MEQKSVVAARDEYKRLEFALSQVASKIDGLERAKASCVEDAGAFARACEALEGPMQERERLTLLVNKAAEHLREAERDEKRAKLAAQAKGVRDLQERMVGHAKNLACAANEFHGILRSLTHAIGRVSDELATLTKLEAEVGEPLSGVERRDPQCLARAHYLFELRSLDGDFSPLAGNWMSGDPPKTEAELLGALRPLLGGPIVSDGSYTTAEQIRDLMADTFGERMLMIQIANERERQEHRERERANKKQGFEREVLDVMRGGMDRKSAIAAVLQTHKYDRSIVLS